MLPTLQKILPLAKWILTGVFAIIVDISLLYILVEFFNVYYLIATTIAFLSSASVNYAISRLITFRNARNSISRSYVRFMSISLMGLGAIDFGMYLSVDVFGFNYLLTRIFLACTLGVGSFFIHKYISFNDASKI